MKTKLALVGLTVAAIGLVACDPPPLSGTVEHKSYSAAYTYNTFPCIAYGTRTTRVGNTTTTSTYCMAYGIRVNYMPATYQLCVRGANKNGKIVSDCWYTNEADYNSYHEGEHWPHGGT